MELRPLGNNGIIYTGGRTRNRDVGECGPYCTRDEWVVGVRLGLDLGMPLIDTAEMDGAGHSEDLEGRPSKGGASS